MVVACVDIAIDITVTILLYQKAVKRSYPVGNRSAYGHKNLQYPPGMEKALPCPTAVSRSAFRCLIQLIDRCVDTDLGDRSNMQVVIITSFGANKIKKISQKKL
ncbi:hypothetical protein QT970_09440 [Microcoleus sp. herbarium8]|uniref:hypothetical protein n=1 Tax=Microcoleus sp. herbarium8 TaxID=3055436 RepID=UPI002FD085D2